MNFELPALLHAEDIYDYDSLTLEEKLDELKKNLPKVKEITN